MSKTSFPTWFNSFLSINQDGKPWWWKILPFKALHLLPDPDIQTTKQTQIQPTCLDPEFNETFLFTIEKHEIVDSIVIHFSFSFSFVLLYFSFLSVSVFSCTCSMELNDTHLLLWFFYGLAPCFDLELQCIKNWSFSGAWVYWPNHDPPFWTSLCNIKITWWKSTLQQVFPIS